MSLQFSLKISQFIYISEIFRHKFLVNHRRKRERERERERERKKERVKPGNWDCWRDILSHVTFATFRNIQNRLILFPQ